MAETTRTPSMARLIPAQHSGEERMVLARLRGFDVEIPCPDWCHVDHVEVNELFPEDIYHQGETLALTAPVYSGTEDVLAADIRQTPFCGENDGEAYMCVDASGDGECAQLSATEALAFADQLVAHADRIRRLALDLQQRNAS